MKIREFMKNLLDKVIERVFDPLFFDNSGNMSSLRFIALIIGTNLLVILFSVIIYSARNRGPVYRSDKIHKYELYMLAGFKDTVDLRYEPDQLYISGFFGSYTLMGEGKPFSITVKEGCVNFKPIK